jgi:hypothetical protein
MSFICLILVYFIDRGSSPWWIVFLIGTSVFWLMFIITIPFHIHYLIENWNTRLLIDTERQTATIESRKESFTYDFKDLKTERHLVGHHRPGIIKSYRPVPFDYYGYIKIKTKDNNIFYITSLMTDPFDFPLTIDSTKYRIPFIEGEVSEEEIKRRNEQYWEGRINEFVETFDKLPDENLLYKIDNKEKFEREAVEAAKRIMDSRRKITTANNGA